jgi:hypothetical protein
MIVPAGLTMSGGIALAYIWTRVWRAVKCRRRSRTQRPERGEQRDPRQAADSAWLSSSLRFSSARTAAVPSDGSSGTIIDITPSCVDSDEDNAAPRSRSSIEFHHGAYPTLTPATMPTRSQYARVVERRIPYGWGDLDEEVVAWLAEQHPEHVMKQTDGGITCPIAGHEREWLRWDAGDHRKGSVPTATPRFLSALAQRTFSVIARTTSSLATTS